MNVKLVESLAEVILSLSTEERDLLNQKLGESIQPTQLNTKDLQDEPFVGMWRDREEMADSTKWVRSIRQQHWMSNHAATSND
jgi:hypothetical protein